MHTNNATVTIDNSTSFKCKSIPTGVTEAGGPNGRVTNTKIAVPIKYFSNFWRSLKMQLNNCKIHFELNWTKD